MQKLKQNNVQQKRIGSYYLGNLIGTGVFGNVYLGRSILQNFQSVKIAIKQIPKLNLSKNQQERFKEEKINLIKLSNNPHIVQLFDLVCTHNNYYFVMQYYEGGDLRQYINSNRKISEQQLQYWSAQIALGLSAMHKNSIVHRDIKPENILLSENTTKAMLYIADLGLSQSLQESELAKTVCGTPLYSAPEVLLGQEYDFKADLYSFGIIMFELLVGVTPFNATTVKELKEMQKFGIRDFFRVQVSQEGQNLIRSLLHYDKNQRPNIAQLLEND